MNMSHKHLSLLVLSLVLVPFGGCAVKEQPTDLKVSELQLVDGANLYDVEAAGSRIEGISFYTSGAWRTTVSGTVDKGWINLDPRSGSEAGTHSMTITLSRNDSGKERSAGVTISCGDAPEIKLTLRQACFPRINTQSLSVTSPKLGTSRANPLVDFIFCADPTAITYGDRLYVYGTNDHQQYELSSENTYEKIKSLVMLSTDDLVNWTYHGTIPTADIAPWIVASWAPSVVCRRMEDGSERFYLYFSNSGWGVGVLQSTSPVGPWTSPLSTSLIDGNNETVKGSGNIFDPGAVIDDGGNGWLAFGNTQGWLARLNPDMISFADPPVKLLSPYHFEANELNYIGGTYVYTYNNNWSDHTPWTLGGTVPGQCSMVYMKSTSPLAVDSWTYGGMYFKNPGYNGFGYGNNHTHMHKFQGKWYLLYHTGLLQSAFDTKGGFRSIYMDTIEVDEENVSISECLPSHEGVKALKNLNPFESQFASTTAATEGIVFSETGEEGHVTAQVGTPSLTAPKPKVGIIEVRGVDFGQGAKSVTCRVKGTGLVSFRLDDYNGQDIVTLSSSGEEWTDRTESCTLDAAGVHTLYIVMEKGIGIDTWQFSK